MEKRILAIELKLTSTLWENIKSETLLKYLENNTIAHEQLLPKQISEERLRR